MARIRESKIERDALVLVAAARMAVTGKKRSGEKVSAEEQRNAANNAEKLATSLVVGVLEDLRRCADALEKIAECAHNEKFRTG